MKISLITVVYNGQKFLRECLLSVFEQTYNNIEYIVIDGGSTDGTIDTINSYICKIHYFISEKDNGLYDAINKGIKAATGEVIGILNADDMFANHGIVEAVANQFINNSTIDGVYGDLNYINPVSGKIIRKWKSKQASLKDLEKGWMPAHPTLYLKKELFLKLGGYALDLGTTADYDLILRFFYTNQIKAMYLSMLMVNMRLGGVSNGSVNKIMLAAKNDYKALKRNNLPNPILTLVLKKLSKLIQF